MANWSEIVRRTFIFLVLTLLASSPLVGLYYGADRGLAVETGIQGDAEGKTGAGMRPFAAWLTDRGPFLLEVRLVGDVIAESHESSLRPDVLVIDYHVECPDPFTEHISRVAWVVWLGIAVFFLLGLPFLFIWTARSLHLASWPALLIYAILLILLLNTI
jgi:hypothetical protein